MEVNYSKAPIYALHFIFLIWLSSPLGFASCPSIFPSSIHTPRYTLNASDFRAKGDGLTDDCQAIQDALQCAQQLRNSSLIAYSGVYRIASSTSMEAQLELGSWTTPVSIQIIGTNTVFRTEQAGSILLRIQGYLIDGLIQGIDFQNNHPLTTLSSVGGPLGWRPKRHDGDDDSAMQVPEFLAGRYCRGRKRHADPGQ